MPIRFFESLDIWPRRAAFAHHNENVEFLASSGVVSTEVLFMEEAMRDLCMTLQQCRGITRQVLAAVPLRACLHGHPVVPGLPVPTNDLNHVADGWS